jgi:hypothetical protein
MAITSRVRLLLARRRWLRWAFSAALAGLTALTVHDRLQALDDARRGWSEARTVLVADADHAPGDPPRVSAVRLPVVAVPPAALAELQDGARLRRSVSVGEILVEADVTAGAGPAAGAPPGTAVVSFAGDAVADARAGLPVRVVAEGVVLAEEATIVAVTGGATHVAVPAASAPAVAASVRSGTASVVYLP